MKTTIQAIGLATVATLALVGCGGGGGNDTTTTTSASTKKAITYQNGEVLGETCGDIVSSNGVTGMSLCTAGTGDIVGFIRDDATVTDKIGAIVGECSPDFDISLLGQEGDTQGTCALSVNSDYAEVKPTSNSGSSSSSGNVPKTIDNTTGGNDSIYDETQYPIGDNTIDPNDPNVVVDHVNTDGQYAPNTVDLRGK